jgi:lipoyl synthase
MTDRALPLIDTDRSSHSNTGPPDGSGSRRLPGWFKVPAPGNNRYTELKKLVKQTSLHTVCEEARCPNIGECWGHHGTATFMILGDVCTRSCGFCSIKTGHPPIYDEDEPRRVAEAVSSLGLRHAVITSVNRDERVDGGSLIFAETIRQIRALSPGTTVEVLISDFKADRDALDRVIDAAPEILNHNVETVPRLYPYVRPQARYEWSLSVLRHAKERGMVTKTGIMVGLGEEWEEIIAVMEDLARMACDVMTIGQYLQPTPRHVPISRFYDPGEFVELKRIGERLGIAHVESGPLVRSSYHAADQADRFQHTD